jgi:energy-coupling factor transporter ATP-binding protein EcfA2
MHPKIARLYANNYRCFVNFELRPGRRNLLLGYNGTGKSSVFDMLAAIRMLIVYNGEVAAAFPARYVTKFGGSAEQRFEVDVDSEWGTLRYALHIAHNLEQETATIVAEEVMLEGKPLYRFASGEVQLYGDDHRPAKDAFPFSPQRSFLASLGPKPVSTRVEWLKEFLRRTWILRLEPPRMGASSTTEDMGLFRDGSNFADFCRHYLQGTPHLMYRAHEDLREVIPGFQHLSMQASGRAKVLVATFRYPGGAAFDLDFDALSDGQKTLVVLYVVLHVRGPVRSVFCLDEPDNFVSIREIQPFLTKLADTSDETGLQVLLISHSAEVIDYIGPSGAILLERPEGGHTRVGTLATNGALRLSEMMARGWHAPS